jgi:hypothetical protein
MLRREFSTSAPKLPSTVHLHIPLLLCFQSLSASFLVSKHPSSLFSTPCSLFSKNTRVGGTSARPKEPLPATAQEFAAQVLNRKPN